MRLTLLRSTIKPFTTQSQHRSQRQALQLSRGPNLKFRSISSSPIKNLSRTPSANIDPQSQPLASTIEETTNKFDPVSFTILLHASIRSALIRSLTTHSRSDGDTKRCFDIWCGRRVTLYIPINRNSLFLKRSRFSWYVLCLPALCAFFALSFKNQLRTERWTSQRLYNLECRCR